MSNGRKCLVVGGGGREHAMAWRLARCRGMETVFVAPGNAGTEGEDRVQNLALTSPQALALFAEREKLDFTVVGPEGPLADGLVDLFRERGLPIFGPTKAAAKLEWSKDFAKAFMARHGIPTAAYRTFTDPVDAKAYVSGRGAPIVVKADGLAAGKGVVVASTVAEAHAAIDQMLGQGDQAGARVVVEEFMSGEEASFIVMVDGSHVLALAASQDHKRLKDGDEGPNTGGMGAYSPAPVVTPDVHARVLREIIVPTVAGMAAEGTPFTGFLYAGLMIGRDGAPRVVEFNCRLGDPETQVILPRLKTDFAQLLVAGIEGRLDQVEAEWDRRAAMCVVLAADGYPAAPTKGDVIGGLRPHAHRGEPAALVFHAGTARSGDDVITAGGRVLGVTALGDSLKMAQGAVYDEIARIRFRGMQYRTDIGHLALPGGSVRRG